MSAAALRDILIRSTRDRPPRFEVRQHGMVVETCDSYSQADEVRRAIKRAGSVRAYHRAREREQ